VYAKVFTSMWDGSLYGQLEASAVLMACVTLCNAQGILDMTPQAISGRTGWPLEFVEKGLEQLQKPDDRSRTPDEDGRRMVLLDEHRDWGWLIVNYEKYRTLSDPDTIKQQNKIRAKNYRDRKNTRHAPSRSVTLGNGQSRQAEAEAEEGKREGLTPPLAKVGKPKATKRAPPDFTPDLSVTLAKLPDLDFDQELAKFRDWEFKTPRSDWNATWRNWIRNCAERGQYAKRAEAKIAWR